jgi:predicted ATPase
MDKAIPFQMDAPPIIDSYGGRSLHEQSHGESFFALVTKRFGGNGLYLLDEPEAALSPSRQLALLARLHQLVQTQSQFIIATHSPIVMAYPNATIYSLESDAIRKVEYTETEHYAVTRQFLNHHQSMLAELLKD